MAIVLGIAGCSTHAAQGPTQELPLLTATVEVTEPPPGEPSPPPSDIKSLEIQPSVRRPDGGPTVEQGVKRSAGAAVVGAVAIDRGTGETIISENGDRQFAAGSLVKLLIGMDALLRHPSDTSVRRQVTRMIQLSDDPIANSFWGSEGGTAIVSRMRVTMSLQSTEPPVPASRWGNTLVSANDLARIYDYIMTRATAADRLTIVEAMAAAPSTGSDGFKQHFGIPTATKATGLQWAVKQAWTTDLADRKAVHSTGLVGKNWRYIVIVLTEHPAKQTWDTTTRSVTTGAQVALTTLG